MKELVLSQEEISAIVKDLANKLEAELRSEEKPPVFLCVMKGAMPFYSDLVKEIKLDILCDYIQLSSYEGGLASTGRVSMEKDLGENLDGRTVIIVEDIVDSGLSMAFLKDHINSRFKPKRILICALFDKICARTNGVKVDFCGKELHEAKFLVGYGLDYRQLLRNVPYVFVPDEKELAFWDSLDSGH